MALSRFIWPDKALPLGDLMSPKTVIHNVNLRFKDKVLWCKYSVYLFMVPARIKLLMRLNPMYTGSRKALDFFAYLRCLQASISLM
jgi:hypothetical protein